MSSVAGKIIDFTFWFLVFFILISLLMTPLGWVILSSMLLVFVLFVPLVFLMVFIGTMVATGE